MQSLEGRVAVVTGASRGAGRAIAEALGEAGATVYVTGRSVRGATTEGLPGSIDETAAQVSALGGHGIAVRCDHTRDADVAALFARVREERGRLDLLVNNAWGGYEAYDGATFDAPFWEQPVEQRWQGMFVAGVRAHLLASHHAAPLLLAGRRGLIVGTVAWAFGRYMGNLFYDVAKAAIIRAMADMAEELRPHRVAAVALAPGFMRTERVLRAHAEHPFDLGVTESPSYLARAVAALASDPDVLRHTGKLLTAGELAREYGFTDVDGRQPEPFRMPA